MKEKKKKADNNLPAYNREQNADSLYSHIRKMIGKKRAHSNLDFDEKNPRLSPEE